MLFQQLSLHKLSWNIEIPMSNVVCIRLCAETFYGGWEVWKVLSITKMTVDQEKGGVGIGFFKHD